jgi:D-serine deaminase-like pyridoxal phosphate-dependent protein
MVLATVVSVPAADRAIIDADSKVLTSDLLGLTGFGHALGRPEIAIDQLSEEHGRLVSAGPIGLSVGDKVRIVPNHACVVTNMVDSIYAIEADSVALRSVETEDRSMNSFAAYSTARRSPLSLMKE